MKLYLILGGVQLLNFVLMFFIFNIKWGREMKRQELEQMYKEGDNRMYLNEIKPLIERIELLEKFKSEGL